MSEAGGKFTGDLSPIKPLNPWGRKAEMPKGWKSPLRQKLYQVWVDDQEKGQIPVGPQMLREYVDDFAANLTIAIKSGRITGWADPTILPVPTMQTLRIM